MAADLNKENSSHVFNLKSRLTPNHEKFIENFSKSSCLLGVSIPRCNTFSSIFAFDCRNFGNFFFPISHVCFRDF